MDPKLEGITQLSALPQNDDRGGSLSSFSEDETLVPKVGPDPGRSSCHLVKMRAKTVLDLYQEQELSLDRGIAPRVVVPEALAKAAKYILDLPGEEIDKLFFVEPLGGPSSEDETLVLEAGPDAGKSSCHRLKLQLKEVLDLYEKQKLGLDRGIAPCVVVTEAAAKKAKDLLDLLEEGNENVCFGEPSNITEALGVPSSDMQIGKYHSLHSQPSTNNSKAVSADVFHKHVWPSASSSSPCVFTQDGSPPSPNALEGLVPEIRIDISNEDRNLGVLSPNVRGRASEHPSPNGSYSASTALALGHLDGRARTTKHLDELNRTMATVSCGAAFTLMSFLSTDSPYHRVCAAAAAFGCICSLFGMLIKKQQKAARTLSKFGAIGTVCAVIIALGIMVLKGTNWYTHVSITTFTCLLTTVFIAIADI